MWINEKRVFVTGTDTGVGKTFLSGKLIEMYQSKGFHTGYYKPLATGAVLQNDKRVCLDARYIKKRYNLTQDADTMVSQVLSLPAAPLVAAIYENIQISVSDMVSHFKRLCDAYEALVVEGVGGVLVPIREEYFVIDLIKELQLSCVVVARPDVGTLNHTLLTVKTLRDFGITVLGVFISCNSPREMDLGEKLAIPLISTLGNVPVLHQFNYDMETSEYE